MKKNVETLQRQQWGLLKKSNGAKRKVILHDKTPTSNKKVVHRRMRGRKTTEVMTSAEFIQRKTGNQSTQDAEAKIPYNDRVRMDAK